MRKPLVALATVSLLAFTGVGPARGEPTRPDPMQHNCAEVFAVTDSPAAPFAPGGVFTPLSDHGVAPLPAFGDDTVYHFNTGPMKYLGRTFTNGTMSSNGFIVLGEFIGDASPQNRGLPAADGFDNVIAPLWMDLDPSAGGTISGIDFTFGGGQHWIVFEWLNVPERGRPANTHSFQVWIGKGDDVDPTEDVFVIYGPQNFGPPALVADATAGFENADGTDGDVIYFNDNGIRPFDGLGLRLLGDRAPNASMTSTALAGPGPHTVTFSGANSEDNTSIAHYRWEFSDGTVQEGAGLSSLSKVFPVGLHTARLIVTDTAGLTCDASATVDSYGSFFVNDVTVNESVGDATFTITRSSGIGVSSVDVEARQGVGTARVGDDFLGPIGTVTFADGETTKTFVVPILDDTTDEPSETFGVRLSNPVRGRITIEEGLGTIVDNDAPVTVSIADASLMETNSGTRNMRFQLTLGAPSGVETKVRVRTTDGTALAGSDYRARNQVVRIPAGATSAFFTVAVIGDTTAEAWETFGVSLSNPVNVTIADGTAIGTIGDND